MSFALPELGVLLQQAMRLLDALEVRELYVEKLDERGLGGLIRAGKKHLPLFGRLLIQPLADPVLEGLDVVLLGHQYPLLEG
ncbi:MAG: hypothetical protein GWP56_17980 [Gammaproteobacteria bacterium]|jgi:hypothetical protein|nr:hypothetical protein [Gammaproteobacteria bacterium]